jgi:uncharacterized protein YpmS
MNYEIIEIFSESSDRYRFRIKIDENSTQFFKFDHYPTQEEVNELVESYLSNLNKGEII